MDENPYSKQYKPACVPAAKPYRRMKPALIVLCSIGTAGGVSLIFLAVMILIGYAEPYDPRGHWAIIDLSGIVVLFGAISLAFGAALLSLCLPNLIFCTRRTPPKRWLKWLTHILIPVVLVVAFIIGVILAGQSHKNYHDKTISYEGAVFTYYNSSSFVTHITISGLAEGSAIPEKLILPSEIGGIEVDYLSEGCFSELAGVKEVVLPDTLNYVPKNCFTRCYSLEKVTLPQGLQHIGAYAFSYCVSLREINDPGTHSSLLKKDVPCTVDMNAFYGCRYVPDWAEKQINESIKRAEARKATEPTEPAF